MFFTYILYSERSKKHYYGSSSDLQKRLDEHNKGKVKYTKPFIPWKIIYYEEYHSRSEAFKRELFFKTIEGYKWLKEHNII